MLDLIKMLDDSKAGDLQKKLEQAEEVLQRHGRRVEKG